MTPKSIKTGLIFGNVEDEGVTQDTLASPYRFIMYPKCGQSHKKRHPIAMAVYVRNTDRPERWPFI